MNLKKIVVIVGGQKCRCADRCDLLVSFISPGWWFKDTVEQSMPNGEGPWSGGIETDFFPSIFCTNKYTRWRRGIGCVEKNGKGGGSTGVNS